MLKKYRNLIIAIVVAIYAAIAIVFTDQILPDQEIVIDLIDAFVEAFTTEGIPE